MGEFRIGRKFAQHSYPESRRNTTLPFARNSAFGPSAPLSLTTGGVLVPWASVEAGAPPGSTSIPITPQVTGIVRMIGMFLVQNTAVSSEIATFLVSINGGPPIPVPSQATVDAGTELTPGFETLPFVLDLPPLPVGTTSHISVLARSSADNTLTVTTATFDVQELPLATG